MSRHDLIQLPATVNNLRPDLAAIAQLSTQLHMVGITVFGQALTTRLHYASGRLRPRMALGRDGYVSVHVNKADKSIEIGGACVTCVNGTLQK